MFNDMLDVRCAKALSMKKRTILKNISLPFRTFIPVKPITSPVRIGNRYAIEPKSPNRP